MKKIAYFDCFAGVSGDMILGALLDAGLSRGDLRAALDRVPVSGYRFDARRVKRAGISGTKVTIRLKKGAGKKIRGLDDIIAVVRESALPESVTSAAERVFRELARVEAKVHGSRLPDVHFHELGAVDSIIDIVGSLAGLHMFGVEDVYASALPWNSGSVECAHGTLPVPAPAVAELMKGMPVYQHRIRGELVTPTGAVIMKCCARGVGSMPPMKVSRVGYGAGGSRFPGFPNLLRLVIGEAVGSCGSERVTVIETEIDDMSPAIYAHMSGKLFAGGALDVFTTPVMMKKSRVGQLLTVLCHPDRLPELTELILRESTTLGVRFREEQRIILSRETMKVKTPHGQVRVKLAIRPEGVITVSPEYDDCVRIAAKKKTPLIMVITAASRAAEEEVKKKGMGLFKKIRRPRNG